MSLTSSSALYAKIRQYGLASTARLYLIVIYSVSRVVIVSVKVLNFATGDMFECCEAGFAMTMVDEAEQSLDLDEPADVLNVLLSLLHTPPHPPQKVPKLPEQKYSLIIYPPVFEYGTVIPFPLIPRMLQLADKYALSESTSQSLLTHLAAHVSSYPLEVYGFATERGLDKLAVDASKHLLHPPLSAYSPEQIRVVPTPEAWHKLVILHDGRIRGLRKILHQEEIFPHGYGACSLHQNRTLSLWNQRKMEILHKIEAG